VEGLVALAQAGWWGSIPGGSGPATPGGRTRLVFDLDPAEDVPFARVVEARWR
jgi:DNA primase